MRGPHPNLMVGDVDARPLVVLVVFMCSSNSMVRQIFFFRLCWIKTPMVREPHPRECEWRNGVRQSRVWPMQIIINAFLGGGVTPNVSRAASKTHYEDMTVVRVIEVCGFRLPRFLAMISRDPVLIKGLVWVLFSWMGCFQGFHLGSARSTCLVCHATGLV
ncbi:uncharacterized protein BCR38DRAFT_5737 [Pseudomassariella vexata]|uniref:Uncharacterized protein n=1 Tax=Pseudomassariella vexata TaxID=1141098 RepID=A0A1Y2EI17_9PEZI|nr:uncharacterized protein BCR38DRAFT_5737 [Pseudomassariella vexata]ORY71222.1 hypothetical protein BCR38DRAFT_5737 [Pseudomassariella vexata]